MAQNIKKGPRRGARANSGGLLQLPGNPSSNGTPGQSKSSVDGLFPLRVRPLAFAGDRALVSVDGLIMVWDARGLAWLHAHGHARCDCGRCSEAVTQ
jgi:hypothetical protein